MSEAFKPAERLNLPAYPFAELERKASRLKREGKPLFDLSIGDPDLPPPAFLVDAVKRALDEPRAHVYPTSRGDVETRRSVARWFEKRFHVELDPETQVCILIGAKEGLAHFAQAVVNPGDVVIVPEPSYPVYGRAGGRLVHGKVVTIPLEPERGFLPDLKKLPEARLLYLNYPNNPTGAVADEDFLREAASMIEARPELTVAYDMAYSEVVFQGQARSLLEFTKRAIEFHSLSKMANATGYRVGFAVGDSDMINALVRVKQELDSGVPRPFQRGLQAVLDSYEGDNPCPEILTCRAVYQRRRERLLEAVEEMGFPVFRSPAAYYVWFKAGEDELPFINRALELGVLLTPGRIFGERGRGWARASITAPDAHIDEAINRLNGMKIGRQLKPML